jgi:hypothetical protein
MKFNNYKGNNNIRWGILGKQRVYTAQPVLQEKKETPLSFEPFNSKKNDFVRIDLVPRFIVGGGSIPPSPTPSITPTNTVTPTPTITPSSSPTPPPACDVEANIQRECDIQTSLT